MEGHGISSLVIGEEDADVEREREQRSNRQREALIPLVEESHSLTPDGSVIGEDREISNSGLSSSRASQKRQHHLSVNTGSNSFSGISSKVKSNSFGSSAEFSVH